MSNSLPIRTMAPVSPSNSTELPAAKSFAKDDWPSAGNPSISSKDFSTGSSSNTYRGQVNIHPKSKDSRNFTQCDSLLLSENCSATTIPYIESKNLNSIVEHEATSSKISEDQLFYCLQRGLNEEEAVALIVNGFCKEVLQKLPMEFAVEAQKLLEISLEGSVG